MRLGGQFLEIILYFVNPSLEFLHFLTGIPERYIHTEIIYTENADLLHIFKKLFSLSFLSIYIFLPNKMTLQIFSLYAFKRCNALKFEFPAILSLKIWVSW